MVSWVFNYVYVMTNGQGGPGDATQVTELYIYQTAFQYQSPEIASAAAVMLFAVTLVLIAIFFRVQRRVGGAGSMSRTRRVAGTFSKHALLIVGERDRAVPGLRDDHGRIQDAGELQRTSVGADRESHARRLSRGGQRPVPALAREHRDRSRSRRSSSRCSSRRRRPGDSRTGRSAGATPCSACSSR